MMKLVSVLFVVALGFLFWALQPSTVDEGKPKKPTTVVHEPKTQPTPSKLTRSTQVNSSRAPAWSPKPPPPKKANSHLRNSSRTATRLAPHRKDPVPTLPGLSNRESKDRPDILGHPVATEGEFAVVGYKAPGDEMDPPAEPTQENESFPRVTASSFKKSVRSFYENLPKNGAIPSRILVEEVLPQSLVQSIGVPPETELKMLGPHYVSDIKSFKYVLGSNEDLVGVSYTTPDGKYHRKYVRLEGEKGE